jgi:hypothetical protein
VKIDFKEGSSDEKTVKIFSGEKDHTTVIKDALVLQPYTSSKFCQSKINRASI